MSHLTSSWALLCPVGFPTPLLPGYRGSFLFTINQQSTTTTKVPNLVKASKTLVVDHFEDLFSRWSLMEPFFLLKSTTWAWWFYWTQSLFGYCCHVAKHPSLFRSKDTKHTVLGDKPRATVAITALSAAADPYSLDWAEGYCQRGGTSSPLQSITFRDLRAKEANMFRSHVWVHPYPRHRPGNRASLEMGSRKLWSKIQFMGKTLLSFKGFWLSW